MTYDRTVAYDYVGKPAEPAPREMSNPRPLGDCRQCGRPSHGADGRGPIHLCCIRAEARGARRCGACAESAKAARRR